MLTISIALTTLQLYIVPMGSVRLPIAIVAAFCLWKSLRIKHLLETQWLQAFCLLIVAQTCAISWSPNPYLGFRLILYSLPFALVTSAILDSDNEMEVWVRKGILVFLASTAIQAALVILFRAVPSIEIKFLLSPIVKIFIAGDAVTDISFGGSTVLDPNKSGGLFLNGNVAAVFMGMVGFISWGLMPILKAPWLKYVAIINFIAVVFAGSKAAILIELALLGAFLVRHLWGSEQLSLRGVVMATLALTIITPIAFFSYREIASSSLITNSLDTLETRFPMWDFAWQAMISHPWTGLGFGGWELDWPVYAIAKGLNPIYPPHNGLLNYFIQSGAIAVCAALWFAVAALRQCYVATNSTCPSIQRAGLGIGAGVFWFFLQAMGENYG
jgi:O-antigen ligase